MNDNDERVIDPEKLDYMSMDVEAADREKLRAVFPQCFVEGKLDIDKLLNLCGEYITNDFEKYKFEWKGKSECYQIAGARSMGTLRPCVAESVDWDATKNVYIEGDNLEVLKLLQTAYFRKIKAIYVDPPYNTGNDFVYADDFKDPMARYKEVTSQTTKSNPESMGRFHTNWLNMMWPRLRLAANLLRDDGVIFISIDDNEVHNLRKLCDEIFGEENFIAQITVQSNPRGRQSDTFLASVHDFLIVYAKNAWECAIGGSPLSDDQRKEFGFTDENGDYRLLGLRQRGSASRREDRPDMYFPIYVNTETGEVTLEKSAKCVTVLPRKSDGTDGRWMWGKEKCQNDIKRLVSKMIEKRGEYDIFVKDYLDRGNGERTRKYKTIWDSKELNNQYGTQELKALVGSGFSFPKSSRFLMDIVRMATAAREDDIVMDFFSGSATTAHAVMQLNAEDGGNRRFILVQLPELTDVKSEAAKAGFTNICEIGKERIRRVGAKITSGPVGQKLDTGFRVFKLDTSNIKVWDDSPLVGDDAVERYLKRLEDFIDPLVKGRADEDVVFEVMLRLGQDLCTSVVRLPLDENRAVWGVAPEGDPVTDVMFMVCLAPDIQAEDAAKMAEYAPGRVIFAEQCFSNTEQKANVRLTLKERGITIRTL